MQKVAMGGSDARQFANTYALELACGTGVTARRDTRAVRALVALLAVAALESHELCRGGIDRKAP